MPIECFRNAIRSVNVAFLALSLLRQDGRPPEDGQDILHQIEIRGDNVDALRFVARKVFFFLHVRFPHLLSHLTIMILSTNVQSLGGF